MKVKDLWKGIVPPAASRLVDIPGGGCWTGTSWQDIASRKEKGGRHRMFIWSVAAFVVLFENAAHLWELDQAKTICEFVFFPSVLYSVVAIC